MFCRRLGYVDDFLFLFRDIVFYKTRLFSDAGVQIIFLFFPFPHSYVREEDNFLVLIPRFATASKVQEKQKKLTLPSSNPTTGLAKS